MIFWNDHRNAKTWQQRFLWDGVFRFQFAISVEEGTVTLRTFELAPGFLLGTRLMRVKAWIRRTVGSGTVSPIISWGGSDILTFAAGSDAEQYVDVTIHPDTLDPTAKQRALGWCLPVNDTRTANPSVDATQPIALLLKATKGTAADTVVSDNWTIEMMENPN